MLFRSPLAILIFLGPAILLCRRYPVPGNFPSVFHTENHHMVFWHYYLFDLVKESLFIEIIQAQDFRTLLHEDCLRDTAFRTTVPAFQLMRAAIPEFFKSPVCAEIVHITPAADAAFDFSGEAGRVQGLIGQRPQFLPPSHLLLYVIKGFLVDDWFMRIFNVIFGKFAPVLDRKSVV